MDREKILSVLDANPNGIAKNELAAQAGGAGAVQHLVNNLAAMKREGIIEIKTEDGVRKVRRVGGA